MSKEQTELEKIESDEGEKIEYTNSFNVSPIEEGEESEYEEKRINEINNQEELPEELEKDEGEMDYSDIEMDARGVPILNKKDLDNILYCINFLGADSTTTLENIKSMNNFLNEWFEYQNKPEEEKDEYQNALYSEESKKIYIEALAKIQREARSSNIVAELQESNITTLIENTNACQLFLTSLFENHIKNENDTLIDRKLSIRDNLREKDFYFLFLYDIENLMKNNNIDEKYKNMLHYDTFNNSLYNFSKYFKIIFNNVATRNKFGSCSKSVDIIGSIINCVQNYLIKFTRYRFVLDNDFRRKYCEKLLMNNSENSTNNIEEYMNKQLNEVNSILNKDYLFVYLNSDNGDKDHLLEKSISFLKRMDEMTEKLATDFKNKNVFIEFLVKTIDSYTENLDSIVKKYKFLFKDDNDINEKTSIFDIIHKYIIENVNKFNKYDKDETIKEKEENLDNYEMDLPQIKKDNFTIDNYPNLEIIKNSINIINLFTNYKNNPSNIENSRILLYELINSYVMVYIFKALDINGVSRRSYKSFLFSDIIDRKKPIEELISTLNEIEVKNKKLSFEIETDICGIYLDELSANITVVESSKDSDEMLKNICDYYNINEFSSSKYDQMPALDLFYRKNSINILRYKNLNLILNILDIALKDLEEIISDNNKMDENFNLLKKEIEERDKKIEERLNRLKNKRKKKKQ